MSSPEIITLDPDGDLVLMLDPVEKEPTREDEPQSVISENEFQPQYLSDDVEMTMVNIAMDQDAPSGIHTSDITEPAFKTIFKVHMVVSSQHMCLASPVFKAMLQGEFREGKELKEMKKINLPLPDDDLEAMKILVHIIHCKLKHVPLKVDLNLLTDIAILVDKYRMHEVTMIMAPIWSEGVDKDTWKQYDNIIRWIFIAWVFDMHEKFQSATQVMLYSSEFSVSQWMRSKNLDLPIPNHVLAEIEEARQKAVEDGMRLFRNLLEKYKGDAILCTAGDSITPYLADHKSHRRLCDSMVLGCLLKAYVLHGIFPFPERPYAQWSIRKCHSQAKKLDITTACYTVTRKTNDQHQIHKELIKNTQKLVDAAEGLRLEHLKSKK
ncbi:hypothetical protein ACMFMF_010314 [Clarireedia jacksonii]